MTLIEHPAWCDPTMCTAPAEQPITYEPPYGGHHSTPVQLDGSISACFGFRVHFDPPPSIDASGTWAWLTQGVAPWQCTAYLKIGFYHTAPPIAGGMAPEAVFSLPLELRHLISTNYPMSGGERLLHLISDGFGRDVDELGSPELFPRAARALTQTAKSVGHEADAV